MLVVDDHDLNRELVRSILERRGYEVLQADDGEAGVVMAHRSRPDVILMDLAMPRKDGFAATRELKADQSHQGHPHRGADRAGHAGRRGSGAGGRGRRISRPNRSTASVWRRRWSA